MVRLPLAVRGRCAWPLIGLVLSGFAGMASAAPPLPAAELLARAVDTAPATRAARARLSQARAEARLSALGPYDWTVSGAGVRREIEGEGRFNEWDVALERPVRLPGKAAIDRELGRLMVRRAAAELQSVERDARLQILDAWFSCVNAAERAVLLEQDRVLMQSVADAVGLRRRRGDLAELDEVLALAELATLNAEVTAARMVALDTAKMLATRLEVTSCAVENWDKPAIAAADSSVPDLESAEQLGLDPLVQAGAAAAESASLAAERARRDRLPDPTLGVSYGRERGGEERLGGLFVSVPLGRRRRTAEVAQAEAAAAVAVAEHDAVRSGVRRQRLTLMAEQRRAQEIWRLLDMAALQQRRAAAISARAFELGEISLAESLVIRRAALQSSLAEREAALTAWHAAAVRAAHVAGPLDHLPDTN